MILLAILCVLLYLSIDHSPGAKLTRGDKLAMIALAVIILLVLLGGN